MEAILLLIIFIACCYYAPKIRNVAFRFVVLCILCLSGILSFIEFLILAEVESGIIIFPAFLLPILITYWTYRKAISEDEVTSQNEAKKYIQSGAISMSNPKVSTMVDEAINVINDMLEVGLTASCYSDEDYEGFIIPVADARPPFGKTISYGFEIDMVNVSNLQYCRSKYASRYANANWAEHNLKLDSFIRKYNSCYVPSENRYRYKTTHTCETPQNVAAQNILNSLLLEQVRARCPLADLEGTPIHTKNVAH